MSRTLNLLHVFVLAVAVSAAPGAQSRDAEVSATVTAISDGDTVWVDQAGARLHVRVFGIDAPEGAQAFGSEARAFASTTLLGQRVTMARRGTDVGGRVVARIGIDGRDFGELLVESGLAWHYARYAPKEPRLDALQRAARQARRGLWTDPAPQPPWEFRAAAPPAASSARVAYRGNRGSRVFHAPGCQHYACRNCTVALASVDIARAQGFRPHAACVR